MIEIRRSDLGDLPSVVDLWNREGGPTRTISGLAEAIALLQRDPDALLVAVADGRIIGTLIAGWDGWRMHLYRLVVDRDARRQGIAIADGAVDLPTLSPLRAVSAVWDTRVPEVSRRPQRRLVGGPGLPSLPDREAGEPRS
jgi:GNAT superfamily N-acetyltransferase